MNCIKILHAVEKSFLPYLFISLSFTPFCFADSFALHEWYIVFRVLCLMMLKMYRLLSYWKEILEKDI